MKSNQGKSKFFSKMKFCQSWLQKPKKLTFKIDLHTAASQLLTHIGCEGEKVWENPKKIQI